MSFTSWWREKSGRSKAIAVLAALLIVEMGLCFATPKLIYGEFLSIPKGYDTPTWTWTLMFWQAVAWFVTMLLLMVAVFWHRDSRSKRDRRG